MKQCLIIIIISLLLPSCKRKTADQPSTPPRPEKPVATLPVPFTPPEDSTISMQQITSWKECNPLLDSLTYRYADSFKTEDATARMRYQDDFITAQNKICVRAGLRSGYDEYKWILQNMGNSKNRALLDSINVQKF